MSRNPFLWTLAILSVVSSLPAQESDPPANLQIQLEYQSHKVNLLKKRLELMKESQQVEIQQAKQRLQSRQIEREVQASRVKEAEAKMQAAKQNLERIKQLHERAVISNFELAQAQQASTQAEMEHKTAQAVVQQHTQQVTAEKFEVQRIELHGALEINQVELELLEAEFRIKELKLALHK